MDVPESPAVPIAAARWAHRSSPARWKKKRNADWRLKNADPRRRPIQARTRKHFSLALSRALAVGRALSPGTLQARSISDGGYFGHGKSPDMGPYILSCYCPINVVPKIRLLKPCFSPLQKPGPFEELCCWTSTASRIQTYSCHSVDLGSTKSQQ